MSAWQNIQVFITSVEDISIVSRSPASQRTFEQQIMELYTFSCIIILFANIKKLIINKKHEH